MKNNTKLILGLLFVILVIVATCLYNLEEPKKTKKKRINNTNVSLYYSMDTKDIYAHDLDNIKYTYKNETKELSIWFDENPNFVNTLITELEKNKPTKIYKDGGTKSYLNGDLTYIVCHTHNGNKDIHIGRKLEYSNLVCQMEKDISASNIIDKSKEKSHFVCKGKLEDFYTDENNIYYYECAKSNYVIVEYSDGSTETVKNALKNEAIKMSDLDKYHIKYITKPKRL